MCNKRLGDLKAVPSVYLPAFLPTHGRVHFLSLNRFRDGLDGFIMIKSFLNKFEMFNLLLYLNIRSVSFSIKNYSDENCVLQISYDYGKTKNHRQL